MMHYLKARARTLQVIFLSTIIAHASAQTADKITVIDTRAVDDAPVSFSKEARFHFKESSVIGLPPSAGFYSGVMTIAPWSDNSGKQHHQIGFNDVGLFWRTGWPSSSTWGAWSKILTGNVNGNFDVIGNQTGGTLRVRFWNNVSNTANTETRIDLPVFNAASGLSIRSMGSSYDGFNVGSYDAWIHTGQYDSYLHFSAGQAGFHQDKHMSIKSDGSVGIGTTNPDAKLAVKGDIHTHEVRVDLLGSIVPDYVFEREYTLLPLDELEVFLDEHKHLPEIPPSAEIEQNGLKLKEMNLLLLKKVEELTLYLIDQKRENEQQNELIQFLLKEIKELKSSE